MNDWSCGVTVIIPTFNRWPVLARAVDSVLCQSHTTVSCLVVDDGSTDDTVRELEQRYGACIRILRQPTNLEKSAARNRGAREATTPYVCFLDSDDELTPDSVAQRYQVFQEHPEFQGVVFGNVRRPGDERHPASAAVPGIRNDFCRVCVRNNPVHTNSFMLSRQVMLEQGMFREDLTNREDFELLLRLTARLPFYDTGRTVSRIHWLPCSARIQYSKIVRQGLRVSEYLRSDPRVMSCLGDQTSALFYQEMSEYARAQYKLGMYRDFRNSVRRMMSEWPGQAWRDRRLLKRYIFSCFRRSRST